MRNALLTENKANEPKIFQELDSVHWIKVQENHNGLQLFLDQQEPSIMKTKKLIKAFQEIDRTQRFDDDYASMGLHEKPVPEIRLRRRYEELFNEQPPAFRIRVESYDFKCLRAMVFAQNVSANAILNLTDSGYIIILHQGDHYLNSGHKEAEFLAHFPLKPRTSMFGNYYLAVMPERVAILSSFRAMHCEDFFKVRHDQASILIRAGKMEKLESPDQDYKIVDYKGSLFQIESDGVHSTVTRIM